MHGTITIAPQFADDILNGRAAKSGAVTPREGRPGEGYVHYDTMRISNSNSSSGARVEFLRGKCLLGWIEVEHFRSVGGLALTLEGLDGRQPITFGE